jgi:chemotaxis protein MotB
LPNGIRVEGYTDNVPIRTSVFYSNWELSAARAGSVVRVLAGQGVDASRLAVVGYGEQRPARSNDTADGRNANRRVVVVILATETKGDDAPAVPATAAATEAAEPPAPAPAAAPVTAVGADGGH